MVLTNKDMNYLEGVLAGVGSDRADTVLNNIRALMARNCELEDEVVVLNNKGEDAEWKLAVGRAAVDDTITTVEKTIEKLWEDLAELKKFGK
ncbi:MAG: hypothetical protein GY941_22325 [Planctomycetes bacterium]|nr:hypothetical protein [Planctomycetota bacterium]